MMFSAFSYSVRKTPFLKMLLQGFLPLSIMYLSGCSDDGDDQTSSSAQLTLSAREIPYHHGYFIFDYDIALENPDHQAQNTQLEIRNQAGELVYTQSISGLSGSLPAKYHAPGDYTATLKTSVGVPLADGRFAKSDGQAVNQSGFFEGLTNTSTSAAYTTGHKQEDVPSLGCTHDCTYSVGDSDLDTFTCRLSSECYTVNVKDLIAFGQGFGLPISDDTPLWIQAYGAEGAKSTSEDSGQGKGGFAQTVHNATELAGFISFHGGDTDDDTVILTYFLGEKGKEGLDSAFSHSGGGGGASTLVFYGEAPSLPPGFTNLLVDAGGGGGGSQESKENTGGQGAIAISSTAGNVSAQGGEGKGDGDHNSGGGGDDFQGSSGATEGNDGNGGMGGAGGGTGQHVGNAYWINDGDDNVAETLFGEGGQGGHGDGSGEESGGGGGGFGGGAGGTDAGNAGGGGGGSYAFVWSVPDTDAPDGETTPDYASGSSDGDVFLIFNMTDQY